MSYSNPTPILNSEIIATNSAAYVEIVSAATNVNGVIFTGVSASIDSGATAQLALGASASEVDVLQFKATSTAETQQYNNLLFIPAGERIAAKISSGLLTLAFKVL